jgi:heme-degrading monooxygenase HmoA
VTLIKWITCEAPDSAAFGRAQLAWAQLHGVPGFLGQAGGWSRNTPGLAQIFGFWSDTAHYQAFMDREHVRIAAAQAGTFDHLRIRVLDRRFGIGPGLPAGLSGASLLRLAHCRVREGRGDHFVRVQAEVWNPGMAAAPGMCGGVFAQCGEAEFLVLSAWRTTEDHQRYRDERFGRLRRRAEPAADLDSLTGDLIDVEPGWTVPTPRRA